jgi:hypothetical protein
VGARMKTASSPTKFNCHYKHAQITLAMKMENRNNWWVCVPNLHDKTPGALHPLWKEAAVSGRLTNFPDVRAEAHNWGGGG